MAYHFHEQNEKLSRSLQLHITKVIQSLELTKSSAEEDAFVIQANVRALLEGLEDHLRLTNQLKLQLLTVGSSNSLHCALFAALSSLKDSLGS